MSRRIDYCNRQGDCGYPGGCICPFENVNPLWKYLKMKAKASVYAPFRFYRLCPHDGHTCIEHECLGAETLECPKATPAAPVSAADVGGPTAPPPDWDYYCGGGMQVPPGRGWRYVDGKLTEEEA